MTAKDLKDTEAAIERAQVYFAAHPRSPSAVRRPKLWLRSGTWIAILGPNIEEGIVGIGTTVEAALHAFDAQYLAALRPPYEPIAPSTPDETPEEAPEQALEQPEESPTPPSEACCRWTST